MKTHPSPDRLSLHADRIWVGRTGSKLCSSQQETRLSHRLTQKVFDFADLHVVKQRAFAVYLRATILALQEPARVPPPRSSCLDKHVGAGDGVNGDSREQAGAPREPRAADLGLGMQIGQEAALPPGPRQQRRSLCWAQQDAAHAGLLRPRHTAALPTERLSWSVCAHPSNGTAVHGWGKTGIYSRSVLMPGAQRVEKVKPNGKMQC